MKVCMHCGTHIAADKKICDYCRFPIKYEKDAAKNIVIPIEYNDPNIAKIKKRKNIITIIKTLFAMLAFLGFGIATYIIVLLFNQDTMRNIQNTVIFPLTDAQFLNYVKSNLILGIALFILGGIGLVIKVKGQKYIKLHNYKSQINDFEYNKKEILKEIKKLQIIKENTLISNTQHIEKEIIKRYDEIKKIESNKNELLRIKYLIELKNIYVDYENNRYDEKILQIINDQKLMYLKNTMIDSKITEDLINVYNDFNQLATAKLINKISHNENRELEKLRDEISMKINKLNQDIDLIGAKIQIE